MKQLLLLTILITISFSVFSQLNKNQFIVGGSIAYSSSKFTTYDYFKSKNHNLDVNTGAGYFVFNKLAVGADISFYSFKSQSLDGNHFQLISNTLNLSPFVRYYILPNGNKLNFYGKIEYNYGSVKEKASNDTAIFTPYRSSSSGLSYSIGPVFFINPAVVLELSLSYNTSNNKDEYEKASNVIAGIGFQVHLGNKKKAE